MRLIDADELLENNTWDFFNEYGQYTNAGIAVENAPTIEAEPTKHGRWIPSDKGDCTYICSECGFVRDAYILEEKAYCPRCGADMREVEE